MIHRTVRNVALKCNGTFLENKLNMFYKLLKLRAATPLPYKGGERRRTINK